MAKFQILRPPSAGEDLGQLLSLPLEVENGYTLAISRQWNVSQQQETKWQARKKYGGAINALRDSNLKRTHSV